MEKLLRILFVMCAIAFVTTLTACADNKSANTGGDDKTAKTGGNDNTANAGGNDNTAINPGIFKFEARYQTNQGIYTDIAGVTFDKSKDVYKITINPSLLIYPNAFVINDPVSTFAPAPIFTVAFTDDTLQGFIIPTTADKAEDLSTTHIADIIAAMTTDIASGVIDNNVDLGVPNGITHSFLAADNPGFSATELNAAWSTLAPRAAVVGGGGHVGIPNIESDTKVRVACVTNMRGINKDSFKTTAPADTDDVAIAKDTATLCSFSLIGEGTDDDKTAAYKAWATEVVKLAKDDATKNIQKMSFVGIVTGDDKASEITKAAGITADAETLGVKGFTADASAKLVKAYKISFQKVEIVIAAAK